MTDRILSDLLQPDEVRKQFAFQGVMRLRKNYLTLWDTTKELAAEFENVQWQENGALKARVQELESLVVRHHAQGVLDDFKAGQECPVCVPHD